MPDPPDPSCVCDLHHRSWQHQIPIPLSEATDGICVLMESGRIRFCWATRERLISLLCSVPWRVPRICKMTLAVGHSGTWPRERMLMCAWKPGLPPQITASRPVTWNEIMRLLLAPGILLFVIVTSTRSNSRKLFFFFSFSPSVHFSFALRSSCEWN